MRTSIWIALFATAGIEAQAEEAEATPKRPVAAVAAKAGGIFPQVLNRLNTTYTVAIEVDWVTPLLGSQLALGIEFAYSEPPHQRMVSNDARVPGGSYSYSLVERTFGVYFGPKYFILPFTSQIVPYLSAGLRVQLLDSQVTGSAGEVAFGQNDETGTHIAFGGQLGAGYRLGPGHLALEVQLISSPIDHFVTGKVDVGDLAARLGYWLHF